MISASSEYNKRIGLDGNNLFKFKAPRSIQHEGGDEMNGTTFEIYLILI